MRIEKLMEETFECGYSARGDSGKINFRTNGVNVVLKIKDWKSFESRVNYIRTSARVKNVIVVNDKQYFVKILLNFIDWEESMITNGRNTIPLDKYEFVELMK